MPSAFNELCKLKFEFAAHVDGEGLNKKINISLDRKIVTTETSIEVIIQKDVTKAIEVLRSKIKQDKKGNVSIHRKYIFMDNFVPSENSELGQLMEVGKLPVAMPVLQLYRSSGCNMPSAGCAMHPSL